MNSITTWDPFRELLDFPSTDQNPATDFEVARFDTNSWNPAVDIAGDDKSFSITADFPDVTKKDIGVPDESVHLAISGERHHESEDENPEKTYHRIERRRGSYLRRFALPGNPDTDKIPVKFEDGAPRVSLPEQEAAPAPERAEIDIQ